MIEELIEKAENIKTKEFKTKKQAKEYAETLAEMLRDEEERLIEEQKKLNDKIWQLRHAQSKTFDYWLDIK